MGGFFGMAKPGAEKRAQMRCRRQEGWGKLFSFRDKFFVKNFWKRPRQRNASATVREKAWCKVHLGS
jgi:hypothetical protein